MIFLYVYYMLRCSHYISFLFFVTSACGWGMRFRESLNVDTSIESVLFDGHDFASVRTEID